MQTTQQKVRFSLTFIGVFIGIALFTALGYFYLTNTHTTPITFTTNTKTVTVIAEIADTPTKQQQGLMYREQIAANQAMLFPYTQEQILPFWMKNMRMSIDIVFLNDQKEIVTIFKNVPPCEAEPCSHYPSSEPAQYVIELQAGFVDNHKINEDTKIAF